MKKFLPTLIVTLITCGTACADAPSEPLSPHANAVAEKTVGLAASFGLLPLKQAKRFRSENHDSEGITLPPKMGRVDWFNGYVEAEGRGFPYPIEMDFPKEIPPQEKAMAYRAAQADALRNVLALLNGISLNGKITVGGEAFKNGTIELQGFIRGHQWTSESWRKYRDIQYAKVAVRVPLWGVSSVSSKVYDRERKRFGSVKRHKVKKGSNSGFGPSDYIIIDARGTQHQPALFPAIADHRGKLVYCIAHLGRDLCVNRGLIKYACVDSDTGEPWSSAAGLSPSLLSRLLGIQSAEADEAGPDAPRRRRKRLKPKLVARATKSSHGKLILDKKSASNLAKDPKNHALLNAGRVIVITDSRVAAIEGARPHSSNTMLAKK